MQHSVHFLRDYAACSCYLNVCTHVQYTSKKTERMHQQHHFLFLNCMWYHHCASSKALLEGIETKQHGAVSTRRWCTMKQPNTERLIVLRTDDNFSRVWLWLLSGGLDMNSYLIGPVTDTHGFAELTSFLFISTISMCIADLILHSHFSYGPTW